MYIKSVNYAKNLILPKIKKYLMLLIICTKILKNRLIFNKHDRILVIILTSFKSNKYFLIP